MNPKHGIPPWSGDQNRANQGERNFCEYDGIVGDDQDSTHGIRLLESQAKHGLESQHNSIPWTRGKAAEERIEHMITPMGTVDDCHAAAAPRAPPRLSTTRRKFRGRNQGFKVNFSKLKLTAQKPLKKPPPARIRSRLSGHADMIC